MPAKIRDEFATAVDEHSAEKQTSISAHVIRTISVNMSMIEMDTFVGTFGRTLESLTNGERAIQDEFIRAVEEVRFGR
jgi:hypothetical protein